MGDRPSVAAAWGLGIFIAAGLGVAGGQLRSAIVESRRAERFVTVRGLAEREVKADRVTWPIQFTAVANELLAAHAKGEGDKKVVLEFLQKAGIEAGEIDVGQLNVVDNHAREYGGGNLGAPRYIVTQSLVVHSTKVDAVAALAGRIADLVKAGVVLARNNGVTYRFTGINAIKPALLAEATRNARAAAEQFAADAGARVGSIRRASQGALSLIPAEEYAAGGEEGYGPSAEQWPRQKVRVVMTVDFFLEQ